jgi:hypothetical protein
VPDIGLVATANPRASSLWRAALREPLVHFFALSAALFLVWPLIADRIAPAPNTIVITQGDMQRAIEVFVKTHLRTPNQAELADLTEQQIQTAVLYREGLALGLDRDDEIIRRRIEQKLKFMIDDVADQTTPTDTELQHFLDTHPALFAAEPSIAFSQVYLNPSQHGAHLAADAAALRAKLNASDGRLDYAADSDVLPVPNDFEATQMHVVADMFGDDFAAAVANIPPGTWAGPIPSGYGQHLVLIRQRIAGTPPRLAAIRDAVLREWQNAHREDANNAAYQQMRAKYSIRVDMPTAIPAAP